MNPLLRTVCFGLTLLLTAAVHAADPVSSDEAAAVVTAYGDALKQGDTAALGEMMGGALLSKRAPLLDSPDYGRTLSDLYLDSTFQIRSILADQNRGDAVVRIAVRENGITLEKELVVSRTGTGVRIIDERIAID